MASVSKNNPDARNKDAKVKRKTIGTCGHEVIRVRVKRPKGAVRMHWYCEQDGVLAE